MKNITFKGRDACWVYIIVVFVQPLSHVWLFAILYVTIKLKFTALKKEECQAHSADYKLFYYVLVLNALERIFSV